MGLAAIVETLYQRELVTTKRKWAVVSAFLLLIILAIVFIWLQPSKPLVVFRLLNPPTRASAPDQIEWRMAVVNIGQSKQIAGWYDIERKGTDGRISEVPEQSVQSVNFILAPGKSQEINVTMQKDSKDELRLVFNFTAQSKLGEKIYRRFQNTPIFGRFVPTPRQHRATSQWLSPSLTNANGL